MRYNNPFCLGGGSDDDDDDDDDDVKSRFSRRSPTEKSTRLAFLVVTCVNRECRGTK